MLSNSDPSDAHAGDSNRRELDEAVASGLDPDLIMSRVVASLAAASGGLRANEVASIVGISVLQTWSVLTALERGGTLQRIGSLWVTSAGQAPR